MKFKPQLAPNEKVNLDEIKYPILASTKLDGIRCIFYKGEMLSRSLKPIVNKQLREKFQSLVDFSKEYNLILDGEIYSHELTFQDIVKYVMTQDFEDKKSIKKNGKVLAIPDHLKFYCFDVIRDDNFNEIFSERYNHLLKIVEAFYSSIIICVVQANCNSKEEINDFFEDVLKDGYEGLILKDSKGRYKCGRGTIREGLIYKVKPFRTFDAKIIDVIQATKVDPDAEKKTNELGRSVTSKKKDDRILIEKASAFLVKYEGLDLKVVIAKNDKEKEEVWKNKENYIGKTIEYKGMLIGAKDVPRHSVMIRYRGDKDAT
jgi:DNA ligase-1